MFLAASKVCRTNSLKRFGPAWNGIWRNVVSGRYGSSEEYSSAVGSGAPHGHRMDSAAPRSALLSDAEKYKKITIENSH